MQFSERVGLDPKTVYSYFRTPEDWTRLYGAFGATRDLGDGWYAIGLRSFPFPLVAKIVTDEPERRVRWRFRGFWSGEGEVRLEPVEGGVVIDGFEDITPKGLSLLAPLVERWFLERRFRALWAAGFRRLRKQARGA